PSVPVVAAPPPTGGALRAPAARADVAAGPPEPVPNVAGAPTADPRPPMPQSFAEVLALFDQRREAVLRSHLASSCHLVRFEPGRIEFRPAEGAPRDLANRLGQLLGEWTGTRWLIAISEEEGAPTLRQQQASRDSSLRNEVADHPLVQAVLETFPGATIAAVRERAAGAPQGGQDEREEPDGEEEDPT
ncbi:MAG: DNA polymerase III subunit gamma/tau, partial [Stellaceae bacterium]